MSAPSSSGSIPIKQGELVVHDTHFPTKEIDVVVDGKQIHAAVAKNVDDGYGHAYNEYIYTVTDAKTGALLERTDAQIDVATGSGRLVNATGLVKEPAASEQAKQFANLLQRAFGDSFKAESLPVIEASSSAIQQLPAQRGRVSQTR